MTTNMDERREDLARRIEQLVIMDEFGNDNRLTRDCAAQMRADAAIIAAMQWQSIETAPKDGTTILVHDGIDPSVAQYWPRSDCWVAMADGRTAIASQGDTWTDYVEPAPNSWMPLPNPPALKGGNHG